MTYARRIHRHDKFTQHVRILFVVVLVLLGIGFFAPIAWSPR